MQRKSDIFNVLINVTTLLYKSAQTLRDFDLKKTETKVVFCNVGFFSNKFRGRDPHLLSLIEMTPTKGDYNEFTNNPERRSSQ
jgi:predicted nuclease of restriction endonuclease-like RecB superfamily